MEEKEAVKRIKNSLKSGLSSSEVRRRLQNKGYKLEYIDLLIKRATMGKKILISLLIALVVIIAVSAAVYFSVFNKHKQVIENPLKGITVNFNSPQTSTNQTQTEIHIDDIEITPQFLSYLLNEIGAWQLHKNPLTGEEPIITFKISDQEFYSVINNEITTQESQIPQGLESDMEFTTSKESLVKAILSDSPPDIFKQSIQDGDTIITPLATQSKLGLKGYLTLYNGLTG